MTVIDQNQRRASASFHRCGDITVDGVVQAVLVDSGAEIRPELVHTVLD
jgi:hypothetical protein